MNRLQKKCLVTSALLHVVLIGSAIVGSAFLDQQPPEEKYPLLEIIPFKTTDELFSGGETPNAPPPNVRPDVPPLPPQAPVETPVRAASDPPTGRAGAPERNTSCGKAARAEESFRTRAGAQEDSGSEGRSGLDIAQEEQKGHDFQGSRERQNRVEGEEGD